MDKTKSLFGIFNDIYHVIFLIIFLPEFFISILYYNEKFGFLKSRLMSEANVIFYMIRGKVDCKNNMHSPSSLISIRYHTIQYSMDGANEQQYTIKLWIHIIELSMTISDGWSF